MYNIVIVEDNKPLSELFVKIINDSENFKVTGAYTNCRSALRRLKQDQPHIVLMDIDLPNGMNGIRGTKEVKKILPNTLVIIVTVYENSQSVFDALCAGADGYLTKNAKAEKIIAALEEAIAGGAPMSIKIAKMVIQSFQRSPKSILTRKETEVLTMLAQGNSYKTIANKNHISLNTMKFHVKNIYQKLSVNTREDAVREASKKKFI